MMLLTRDVCRVFVCRPHVHSAMTYGSAYKRAYTRVQRLGVRQDHGIQHSDTQSSMPTHQSPMRRGRTSLSGHQAMELIFDGSLCTATGCCGASYAARRSSKSPTVYTRTCAKQWTQWDQVVSQRTVHTALFTLPYSLLSPCCEGEGRQLEDFEPGVK